ncbi:UDP-3-O-(3-hydroxymyristoyl)glucosamine N-acyltransferase [Ferrimonas lipolytica]|uniref:UDP-3-O-acylglucosamine N-acyltransferase n=1 Tax=Ferrimonas lipolytica TaxID=2724191 RepID=A0A6H1UE67_9GAMM|nr:UDP-3-O-(3-hydroxymyristoyl)glucosamine N-acyltransferase [Ferrimonas lipolytica]QIZ77385.1 UDP-3-O-(3-hydroxymyristoyl)glucosamine N-acyltransferase [Ferrimonas lipolytica]
MTQWTLALLASALGARVQGDSNTLIEGVATLEQAQNGQLAFLANPKYKSQLETTQASAVLLSPANAESYPGNALILDDPYVGFARVAQLLDTTPAAAVGIHPSAIIDPSAELAEGVAVGANAVIEEGVKIGSNSQIGSGCVVGQYSRIGSDTKLWANVTIYHNVTVGSHCIIHSGAVIGSDGFGYANEKGQWIKIPQTGSVVIHDKVEIGANTTVDRGAIDDTVIEQGAIIDNLVQIAHNVIIGAHSAMAGTSAIAGSTRLGRHCIVGGNSAIAGHIEIAPGTHINGMTGVTGSITKPGHYGSVPPMQEVKTWRRNSVRMRQLDEMYRRIRALEKQLAADADNEK